MKRLRLLPLSMLLTAKAIAAFLSVSATIVFAADYRTVVMADAPKAYWRFNEGAGTVANDIAGSHTATLNAVGYGRPGAITNDSDTAFNFNGATSFVEVPFSADLNPPTFTVEFWGKPSSTTARQVVKSITTSGDFIVGGYEFNACWAGQTWSFGIIGGGWQRVCSRRLVPNEWTHVVGTYDGNKVCLYVNGVLTSSLPCTNYVPNWTSATRFGVSTNAADSFWAFLGDLDEIAIYDHALPEDRVTVHYGCGKYGSNIAPAILQQPLPQDVLVGQAAALAPNAYGDPAPAFQWYKDGLLVPGATRSSFTLASTSYSDTGLYQVSIENSLGTTNSESVKLSVMPPPQFCNVTNSLVLHLKFDGDYLDSSGRANHGQPAGAPRIVSGRIGSGALRYSTDVAGGVYNYVTLGIPSDLQFSSNINFTVSYWARFTGTPGDLPFFCNSERSLANPGFAFAPSYKEGGWAWTLCSTYPLGWSEFLGLGEPSSINDGQWHHLLHSFDRENEGVTFLDGVRVRSCSIVARATETLSRSAAVNIGQDATGRYAESGEVDIDDLGVWRRALTPFEAECVYLAGKNYGLSFDSYGPVTVRIQRSTVGLEVIWQAGVLEAADDGLGPWEPVSAAVAPYYRLPANSTQKFYRVRL